jgi:hypothetical protein
MGFLRRALGGGEKAPEWASFMKADEYQAFEAAVIADFADRGHAVRIVDDGAFAGDGDGDGDSGSEREGEHVYGLFNLAQLCHQLDRADWPRAIREHFVNIDEAESATERLKDFGYARDLLKLRVYRLSDVPPELVANWIHRALSPELVAVLAADLPTTVTTISKDLAEPWNVPIDELFAIATEHMAAELPTYERSSVPVAGGSVLETLSGDTFFVASQIVRFADFAAAPPNGVLVSLPNRHLLVWHPIETAAATIQAVQAMIPTGLNAFQEGPGSLSPDLYWWHRGALTLLPSSADRKGVQFFPPDPFVELLNSLP